MKNKKHFILIAFLLLIGVSSLFGQTGKIQGVIVDSDTDIPLPGVNVLIEGLGIGAATDMNGLYYIINVAPGTYNLSVTMMGYSKVTVQDISVSVNRTSTVPIQMTQSVIEGQEVVVVASKIKVQKDQTSTVKNISSESISTLPVENIDQVVAMQAGVVRGHFRGGRSGEVSYMIDGMQINDAYDGTSKSVDIDPDAVQDMEVITGIFNAEYGRAMSGMVNIIPKEGRTKFEAKVNGLFSNYYTGNTDLFIGLDNKEINRNQDYTVNLSGPIYKDKITFFVNTRYKNNKGHLNGIRRYDIGDYQNMSRIGFVTDEAPDSPWGVYSEEFPFYRYPDLYKNVNKDSLLASLAHPPEFYSEQTGDSSFVPMNWSKTLNVLARLTFKPFSKFKINFTTINNNDQSQGYSFGGRFRPDGRSTNYKTSHSYMVHLNHMLSTKFFYNLRYHQDYIDYETYYYKNPLDKRYVRNRNTSTGYSNRITEKQTIKFDMNWQATKNHNIKAGFDYLYHTLKRNNKPVRNVYRNEPDLFDVIIYDFENDRVVLPENLFELELVPDSVFGMDNYTRNPFEASGYIQDKMEFDDMTINIGLRFDYINPNTNYPTNYRNPANQIYYPDSLRAERYSTYPDAKSQMQISPRFGLSYALSDIAALHFAYGHFYQMPQYSTFYQNHRFLVGEADFSSTIGNPNVKAEKTVKYEFGLQQELMKNLMLDISIFYKDIYNLQAVKVRETYNKVRYGLYGNKDYGNTKGLEFKLDYYSNPWTMGINYTLMYTRGNANNPTSTYSALAGNMDPVPVLIPMSWDQRHTLNVSIGYNQKNYGVNLVGFYNDGTRYTWDPMDESRLEKIRWYPNNSKMPYTLDFDLKSHYNLNISKNIKIRFNLSIYNLLDRKNAYSVNSTTGQPNVIIIQEETIEQYRSNFLTYDDTYLNPAVYSTPRTVKFGVDLILR